MFSKDLVPVTDDSGLNMHELERQLDKVKSHVFLNKNGGFYAPLMNHMIFVWTRLIPTAATDGAHMWWNPDWFLGLPEETRRTVLMHELRHPAGLHLHRIGDRDPDTWNVACDIRINNDLKNQGYTFQGWNAWLRPEVDVGGNLMVEEDIYDWLIANNIYIPAEKGDMIEPDDADYLKRQIIKNVSESIHTAYLTDQKDSIPGNTEETLKQFLSPVVPWQILFERFFNEMVNNVRSWARPNRRYTSSIIVPGRKPDRGLLDHLMFFEDVSGSITQNDSIRFNSELKHIHEVYRPKKMTIVQFDEIIQKVDVIEDSDPFEEVRIRGGGGTCLRCVRQYIIDHNPTAVVIFSDMLVNPMEALPFEVPIIWVAINNRGAKVPFGTLVHIKG